MTMFRRAMSARAQAFCACAFVRLAASAQVEVHVVDDATSQAVPFASIAWSGDGVRGGTAADTAGVARIDQRWVAPQHPMHLHVTSMGYEAWSGTATGPGWVTCRLVPSTQLLQQVVITGQYAPTDPDRTVQRTRVVAASEIRRMAAESLADLLRQELNMSVQQDNVLGSSLSIQGLGGENVKVLVDGVPMTGRLNGSIDLSRVDLSGVDRVEIIEGPMSVAYGTNALAGTINLITRRGRASGDRVQATMQAEHIGRLNLSASGATTIGGTQLQLTAGHNFFGGWDPAQDGSWYDPSPSPADSSRVQQWKPREQDFLRCGVQHWLRDRWNIAYKGELMSDRILARGDPRAPYAETAFDERHNTLEMNHALFTSGEWAGGHRVNAQIAHNRYRRARNTWLKDLTSLEEQLVTTPGAQDTTLFTLTNARATFSSAADSTAVRYELGVDVNIEEGEGARIADGGTERIEDHALFGSMEWTAFEGFTLRPGVRAAYNSAYGAPVVPSLNAMWVPAAGWIARAGWARGFRAPSIKELHLSFVDVNHDLQGNPDLLAERSDHIEASIARNGMSGEAIVRTEIAAFANILHDRITLANVDGDLYTYVNVGEVRTQGASARASVARPDWTLVAGGTFTWYSDDAMSGNGAPAVVTPELQGSITWRPARTQWSATLFGKYTGESVSYSAPGDGSVGTNTISDIFMADVNVGRRCWHDRLTITAGCKNLADVTNVEATISGGAHSGGSVVPMATGRTFFLRLDLDINKPRS